MSVKKNFSIIPKDKNNNNNNNSSSNNEVTSLIINPFWNLKVLDKPTCFQYVAAHSNYKLKPAKQLNDVIFLPNIMRNLHRVGITNMLRLQSHAWPHLMNGAGHGAIIISASCSGRTLSYLLPMCQIISESINAYREELKEKGSVSANSGPIAIVIASDLRRVTRTAQMCNALFSNMTPFEDWFTLTLCMPSSGNSEFLLQLINGAGCLIVTPAQMAWIKGYASTYIQFTQLRFVAIDDIDLMEPQQLREAQQYLREITTESEEQNRQLVITSQSYTKSYLSKFDRSRDEGGHPLLLFGDMLEAAVYGGVQIAVRLIDRDVKFEALRELLTDRPPHQLRTLVYCNTDDDVRDIVAYLKSNGIDSLPYYQNADYLDRERVDAWKIDSKGKVLVSAEFCSELEIYDAETVIHYNLSDTWSKLKTRHLTLVHNLRNHFAPTVRMVAKSLLSVFLLDVDNSQKLPRLVDFMQQHKCELNDQVLAVARQIRMELAQQMPNESALCDMVVSQGECLGSLCKNRHQILEYDRLPRSGGVPMSGDIKVKLVKMYSPVHYCVRLLEHLPHEEGGTWQQLPSHVHSRTLIPSLQVHFAIPENCVPYWPPKSTEVCVYRSHVTFERVRVLSVPPIEHVNLASMDLEVQVQAMDVNTRIFKTTTSHLYICPMKFRDYPSLVVDLRMLGWVPETGEREWQPHDYKICLEWMQNSCIGSEDFLQASVIFSLSHTIFIRNLCAISYAKALRIHTQRLNMRQKLMSARLARHCQRVESKVLAAFSDHIASPYKTELPSGTKDEIVDAQVAVQPDCVNQTMTTTCFRNRFTNKLNNIVSLMGEASCPLIAEIACELPQIQMQIQTTKNDDDVVQTPEIDTPIDTQLEDRLSEMNALLDEIAASENQYSKKDGDKDTKHHKHNTRLSVKSANGNSKQRPQLIKNTPDWCVYPPVTYYQTPYALELQVLLPDDKIDYEAALRNSVIIFGTPDHEINYMFAVNTRCCYIGLNHRKRGRTVYISVFKKWVQPYPLAFQCYKFMKPDYDKNIEPNMGQSWNFSNNKLDIHTSELFRNFVQRNNSDESDDDDEREDNYESNVEHPNVNETTINDLG